MSRLVFELQLIDRTFFATNNYLNYLKIDNQNLLLP